MQVPENKKQVRESMCHRIYHHYIAGAPTKEEGVCTKKIPDKICRYNYVLERRILRGFCSCYSCN